MFAVLFGDVFDLNAWIALILVWLVVVVVIVNSVV